MSFILLVENGISTNENQNTDFIEILFFSVIAVAVLIFIIIVNRNRITTKGNFEEKIIKTISNNKIIDPEILEGLNSEELKLAITQEMSRLNTKYGKSSIDLQKMTLLMDQLEFENLQKLYQWFYSKKACS
ncbi:hypothetical protein [Confluentibacter flavum]|uniref:Uncharacterized protein n=1 Tax=Confluentibacter flavum TaxID=1909700 RepID=A0A2N3HGC4_9FLAO|nr:hypothetical protein [Confluentibacter flavum]PKQ44027.1 hypothetical protein CSW08_15510 [Confluentibacter flavum]